MVNDICACCLQSHTSDSIRTSSAAFALQVCQVKELDHWMLYLVDWGYNTKQEREQAANNPRIQVVNHQQLSQAITQ